MLSLDLEKFKALNDEQKDALFNFINSRKLKSALVEFSKNKSVSKSPYYNNHAAKKKWRGIPNDSPTDSLVAGFLSEVFLDDKAVGHDLAVKLITGKFNKSFDKTFPEAKDKSLEEISKIIDEAKEDKVLNPVSKLAIKAAIGIAVSDEQFDSASKTHNENLKRTAEDEINAKKKAIKEVIENNEKEANKKKLSETLAKLQTANENNTKLTNKNENLKKRLNEVERERDQYKKKNEKIVAKLNKLIERIPEKIDYDSIDKLVDEIRDYLKNGEYDAVRKLAISLYVLAGLRGDSDE